MQIALVLLVAAVLLVAVLVVTVLLLVVVQFVTVHFVNLLAIAERLLLSGWSVLVVLAVLLLLQHQSVPRLLLDRADLPFGCFNSAVAAVMLIGLKSVALLVQLVAVALHDDVLAHLFHWEDFYR
jgi:hypothetical protein